MKNKELNEPHTAFRDAVPPSVLFWSLNLRKVNLPGLKVNAALTCFLMRHSSEASHVGRERRFNHLLGRGTYYPDFAHKEELLGSTSPFSCPKEEH